MIGLSFSFKFFDKYHKKMKHFSHQGTALMRENAQKSFCQVFVYTILILLFTTFTITITFTNEQYHSSSWSYHLHCILPSLWSSRSESYENTMPPPNPVNESMPLDVLFNLDITGWGWQRWWWWWGSSIFWWKMTMTSRTNLKWRIWMTFATEWFEWWQYF